MPDLSLQRQAMEKLAFLVGTWRGKARLWRKDGPLDLIQSEEARYRLDGLLLLIEGVGCLPQGQPLLQALGILSYDDHARTYRMRAFNDGRFLETEVDVEERGMRWGFALGDISTRSVLWIDEGGAWNEKTVISMGSDPPKTLLELAVSRTA